MNAIEKYKLELLQGLYQSYNHKQNCPLLCQGKNNFVCGEGNPDAQLLLIGEAPGREEDRQGKPFVGRSGKLLDTIFDILNINRSNIFISNIVKCRPLNNRKPTHQEIEKAMPLLLDQIKIIRPKAICTLGSTAAEGLLGSPVKISQIRGVKKTFQHITMIPTYHPAYILRNPSVFSTLVDDLTKAYQYSTDQNSI